VPGGQRDESLRPYSSLCRPEPLLFLPSSSSVILTRLSGPRSRPTTFFSCSARESILGPPDLYCIMYYVPENDDIFFTSYATIGVLEGQILGFQKTTEFSSPAMRLSTSQKDKFLVSIKGRNFLHQLRDYRRLRRTNSWFLEKDGIFFTSYATIGV
jgi:hypothetical protein